MVDTYQPTAAERIRSLLESEGSLDVLATSRRVQLIGRHSVTPDGRLRLLLPADSVLALELASADDRLPATVEITDVAAIAMRTRVRARASLCGALVRTGTAEDGDLAAELDLRYAELTGRGAVTRVGPAEFAGAEPDPLAAREAALLCHLTSAHTDLIDWLTRMVPADRLDGVRHVRPLALDRFGVVLRLEFPRFDRDVRLPFTTPVTDPADAPGRMLELLARARTCRRSRGRGAAPA